MKQPFAKSGTYWMRKSKLMCRMEVVIESIAAQIRHVAL